MNDATFFILQVVVALFFGALIIGAGAEAGSKFVESIHFSWRTRHIRRVQRKLMDDIAGGKLGVLCPDCHEAECAGHNQAQGSSVPVVHMNEARVKGKDIKALHNPKIMKRAGMDPITKRSK